jgi:hypothetical protein
MDLDLKSDEFQAVKANIRVFLLEEKPFEWVALDDDIRVVLYSNSLEKVKSSLRDADFFQDFDWLSFGNETEDLLRNPDKVDSISLDLLRKVVTVHFRNEAFHEGHLAEMCENGHLNKLLNKVLTY